MTKELPPLSPFKINMQMEYLAGMQMMVTALFSKSTIDAKVKGATMPTPNDFFDGEPTRRDLAKLWIATCKASIELLEKEMGM